MPPQLESNTKIEPRIEDAVRAIADGAPVAWTELERSTTDTAQIESLHLLEDIAAVFRTDPTAQTGTRRDVMFRWGGLEVESLIGAGSYGDVYRAFDPWLGRRVALKLFRASPAVGAGLDEARRLARLRHRNVLSVYGCGVHDGRAGLWSELIEGRTLSAAVAADGAFSAEETLRIGHDLAQALGVVHAAGLVHGDVKAENVMRENGGRMVLMDFGAGGDARLLAGQRLMSGTPRYLPPEVLDGAPLSVQSDIYALGVLLFLLLSGNCPYTETDAARLREEQRRADRPSLHSLRPEINPSLCALVEACLVTDPAQRPGSARALAMNIEDLLRATKKAPAGRRLQIAAIAIACAAFLTVAAMLVWQRVAPPAWDSAVQFLRLEPGGNVELGINSTLHLGDRLRLRMRSSRAVYVYVLNEDAAGNATVLFPSAVDGMRNPLRSDTTLLLPGGEGATQAWEVTADSASEEFVVIAAAEPQPELERELVDWQHTHAIKGETRAVGAVVDLPAPVLRGEHVRHILAGLPRDAERVRTWTYTFSHAR